ncbi:hypothetical protein [Pseudophaeobacter sp.]|uniref:hypothetical protein n=2 Tax=Pseudophaeobacter sp. TaxID=1971739 RepID=UPI0032D8BE52
MASIRKLKSGYRAEIARRGMRKSKVFPTKQEAKDFAKWRDNRLQNVAPASVIREMQLMSSVLTVARRDLELISINRLCDVRKPAKPQPRDRLSTSAEIEAMQFSAGRI